MPRFSQLSMSRLSTCHLDLQVVFFEVIKYVDCTILEGFRNEKDQELAFKNGNSTLHWPFGKHNQSPSLAVDAAPYPVDWKAEKRFFWFAGIVMGISERLLAEGRITHKIRFGGDWNRNYDITDEKGLKDLVHFEIKE